MSFVDLALISRLRSDIASQDVASGDNVAALAKQLQALRFTVLELSVTVGVLGSALAESGTVDSEALRQRLDHELAAARASQDTVVCARCKARVPKRQTEITGGGIVCDRCAKNA
jgi:hypothetical protein